MNFTHFITNNGKRINREHYRHLVQVARIDGKIQESELELLHKAGRRFGLTDPEIDQLIKSEAAHNYHPPYSLQDKFGEMYNVAQIILADDVITDSEKRMIKQYAIAAGFSNEVMIILIQHLFDGIRKGEDEDTMFLSFKKLMKGR
jgi:uncharacterized tellurite resistance protein B-like protein